MMSYPIEPSEVTAEASEEFYCYYISLFLLTFELSVSGGSTCLAVPIICAVYLGEVDYN